MRIQVFQHVPFETPGYVGDWAAERGHTLQTTHLYQGEVPPAPAAYDWLVLMGGPMGVYDEPRIAWLSLEKRAIAAAIAAGKTAIGFCLGSQLLAEALGARVYVNCEPEIGWMPVHCTKEARAHPFAAHFPERPMVMHWHGDAFDVPAGAMKLASSPVTLNQGFIYGDRVVALQFHIEMTPRIIEALIGEFSDALKPSRAVQSAARIREGTVAHADAARESLYLMLDALAKR